MIKIIKLSDCLGEEKAKILSQVEDIFFLSSSRKEFLSLEKRNAFYKRWCGDYQSLYADEFFLAVEDDKVLGYLSGCSDSLSALSVVSVPGFSVFQDLFKNFPAHLHINFHPDSRGRGLGSLLMNYYMFYLREKKVRGVHLITSPNVKNVSFYDRLGFNYTETRDFNDTPLYFMGHTIENNPE